MRKLLVIICLFSCLIIPFGKAIANQPPNILLLLTDDQGYADLYANLPEKQQQNPKYDDVKKATKTMSQLAQEGVLFTDAHSTGPTCAPSRAGLLTGKYPQRYGFWDTPDSRVGLSLKERTLADVLKEHGYTTGMFGKWHLGTAPMYNPRQRGFDVFYGFLGHGSHDYYDLRKKNDGYYNNIMENYEAIDEGNDGYLTDKIADRAVSFIKDSHGSKKPFFAYVAFNGVHAPLHPPKEGPFKVGKKASKRKKMLGMLGSMDLAMKRLVDTLEELDLTENTVVILMGDNGGARAVDADNGELRLFKQSFYEGGIRVPFILRWPATIQKNQIFSEMVMGFDVFATVLQAAAIEPPAGLDGVNLLDYLEKVDAAPLKTGAVHEALFWDRGDGRFAARLGDYKLIKDRARLELYNLKTNIGEKPSQNLLATGEPFAIDLQGRIEAQRQKWLMAMKEPFDSEACCRDPRYENFSKKLCRHNSGKCKVKIKKEGCLDHKAQNYDLKATLHRQADCRYE